MMLLMEAATMATFLFGLLKAEREPGAEPHNAPWLGEATLGVEVIEPALAARCRLGNVDPQHSSADDSHTAIEAALDWPPPPHGSKLVTLRRDADACGAMAILTMRAEGRAMSADGCRRVGLVADADAFRCGAWPGPRPLPRSAAEIDEVGFGPEGLGAMIVGVAQAPIAEGIAAMTDWLATGAGPDDWRLNAEWLAKGLYCAFAGGVIRVEEIVPKTLCVVESSLPVGLRLGYRRAPTVIAVSSGGGKPRRVAIAQYAPGYVDLAAVAARLNVREPGWGGSTTIIGSPQGVACQTPLSDCVAIVRDCLKTSAASEGGAPR
jgi:hypothetical protein